MSGRSWALGSHVVVRGERAKAAFVEWRGEADAAHRQAAIAALPIVEWKGKTLRTLRCQGETGRGPHDVNLPEQHLWALIDLRMFRCPYHA